MGREGGDVGGDVGGEMTPIDPVDEAGDPPLFINVRAPGGQECLVLLACCSLVFSSAVKPFYAPRYYSPLNSGAMVLGC